MSDKNQTILLYGLTQTNILTPLYREIIDKTKCQLRIFAFKTKNLRKDDQEHPFFEHLVYYVKTNASYVKFLYVLKMLFSISFYRLFIAQRNCERAKNIIDLILFLYPYYLKAKNQIKPIKVDLIHVNYLDLVNTLPFFFLPVQNVIFSFWGSDLLRNNDQWDDCLRNEILKKAKKITIQNEDLKKIVISRFKAIQPDRITVVKFFLDDMYINLAKLNFSGIVQPKREYDVMVGHNGNQNNQHIDILKALNTHNFPFKIRVHLPLAYSLSEEYLVKIREAITHCNFEVEIHLEYLMAKELIAQREKMDLFIHLPTTDAMSGTVTEFLYLGKPVIAGSWLPYSIYNKLNVPISFISQLNNVAETVQRVLDEPKIYDQKSINDELDSVFGTSINSDIWIKILNLC